MLSISLCPFVDVTTVSYWGLNKLLLVLTPSSLLNFSPLCLSVLLYIHECLCILQVLNLVCQKTHYLPPTHFLCQHCSLVWFVWHYSVTWAWNFKTALRVSAFTTYIHQAASNSVIIRYYPPQKCHLLFVCLFASFCLSIVDMLCYSSFRCSTWWLTNVYIMPHSPQAWLPSGTVQHYYSIIDFVPYAVPFIPVIYSFYNWKPVSPIPFTYLAHPATATISLFSVFLILLFVAYLFLHSTYEWNPLVCVFLIWPCFT